jgi:hypothetical protein
MPAPESCLLVELALPFRLVRGAGLLCYSVCEEIEKKKKKKKDAHL